MKTTVALVVTALSWTVCVQQATSQTSKALFFPSNELLPARGLYVARPQTSIGSANGVVVSNLVLRGFSESAPAPPPGTSMALTFDAEADFDLSLNGGGGVSRVSLPVELTVNVSAGSSPTAGLTYAASILEFKPLSNLPGNLALRQSPNRASAGQATITPVAGGFLISGFFDVFLDSSTGGGQNWLPLNPAQHLDLRVDPSHHAEGVLVAEPAPLIPAPDDQFLVPAVQVASFDGGIQIRALRQTLFSAATDGAALLPGIMATVPYSSTLDFELSSNGGQTFTRMRTTANATLALLKVREAASRLFDTEITQMDFSANLPGASKMFRESPSLSSYGEAELQPGGSGGFQLSSFFDVFLELSADGGQTWRALNNGPLHFELQPNSLRGQFASPNLPTPGGQYVLPALAYQTGPPQGVLIAGNTIGGFSASSPPPAAGQQLVQNFTAQAKVRISLDGGATFTDAAGTVAARMNVTRSTINWGDTSYYDAELMQLDVAGLPQGVMIRESPTLASKGRLSITPHPTGGNQVDSFFDVFTELSADGGQTWTAASSAATAVLTPSSPIAPLRIFCPSDLTVVATSASGAVVSYPPLIIQNGDCPLGGGTPSITFSPPDGTELPVGITTVTVTANNACGEHATCSFHVQVLPNFSLVREYVFVHRLLPPPSGMLVEPVIFAPIPVGGILLSNLMLSGFPRSAAPPAPGTSFTLDTEPMAEFDWSLNGGATFTHGRAPAKLVLNIQDAGPGQLPGQELYGLQLERLDISGGDLPAGVMLRESPSRASTGQASVRGTLGPDPNTGLIIIVCDVFLDGSTDGGQNWASAGSSLHLELRHDPNTLSPMPEFTPLFPPPNDQFASLLDVAAMFPGGVEVRNLQETLFSSPFDLSLLAPSPAPVAQQFCAVVEMGWSQDGGATFTRVRVPVLVGLLVQGVRPGALQVFDADVTQMDFAGGDLPQNILLRASPVLPSHGQVSLMSAGDGSYRMTSFFDVFLELSTDGGKNWQAATSGSLHLELLGNSQVIRFASPNQPPSGSQYLTLPAVQRTFRLPTGGIIAIRNQTFSGFTSSVPPPPPGVSSTIDFRGQLALDLSQDGGNTFNSYSAPASAQVKLTGNAAIDWGDRQFLDCQLLQLTAAGGTLPAGLMLRESPTRPSLGRTGIAPDVAGGYRIEGFYDVAQELTLDNGQTWNPAVEGPWRFVLNPPPNYAPYGLTCPSNITVHATSASGAVVYYSFPPITVFPDCPLCCFTATGTPPSGSLFPIGTTTVNCQGNDGCGEKPTCSFTVTVLPESPFNGVVTRPLGFANLFFFHGGTTDPVSMVVSNIGPSGSDGFHVDLGTADSLALNFDPYPNTDITGLVSTVTGPYAGDPNHVLGSSMYLGGPNALVFADFSSLGATSMVARVFDDNHKILSSQTIANASSVGVNNLFPPGCTNPTSTVCTITMGPGFTCWRFCRYGCNCLGTNCTIERVVCFILLAPPPLLHISGFDLTAQGSKAPSSLSIQSAGLGLFGTMHTISGNATLEPDAGLLVVNGIGPSGNDGVNINLNHVGRLDVTLAPLRLLAPNACLTLIASGDVNGLPAVQFGSVSLSGSGGNLAVNGDFSGLGANLLRVNVYLNSQLQGGVTMPGGPLGNLTLNGNLIGAGTLAPMPGIWARFDSPFAYSAGGINLSGNEIHIMVVNPAKQVGALTQFGIRSCSAGQIAILGESVTPLLGDVSLPPGAGISFIGRGAAGLTYRLEGSPALGPQPSWKTVGSAQADDEGYFELSDTPAGAQQFYRAVTP